ncbi:glycosyltransferase family 4 protein [Marininema halotolerans]|uniref:Glycosyltransferase involved in cell wall bisynthesis n=1 Tax=Marininema halotolerans TaxID=1155944 RepID=A0A1I6RP46_9BACL|nr:glycosyltransferase [Marininema halotolerans]SFS66462.1 Glycosyltransferase involved in cell wall bisynthesis [Marininema halotolerans]
MSDGISPPWIRLPEILPGFPVSKEFSHPTIHDPHLRKGKNPRIFVPKKLSVTHNAQRPSILFFAHLAKGGPLSGSEKTLLTMMQELAPRYECHLIAPGASPLTKVAHTLGCKVTLLRYQSFSKVLSKQGYPDGALEQFHRHQPVKQLIQLIRTINPRLAIVNTSVNTVPVLAAHHAGIPVLWWLQEVIPHSKSLPNFLGFMANHATAVLGISDNTLGFRPYLKRKLPTYLIPPAWNDKAEQAVKTWPRFRRQIRSRLGLTEKDLAVGFVSLRASHNKGYSEFMRIASQLPLEQLPIHIIVRTNLPGGLAQFKKQCRQIVKPPLVSRFHLLPPIEDLRQIYPALDLLIVPSLINEGFGLTALEGMAFGKPVIAYRSGGLEEIFRKTNNGRFLAERGDIASLSQKATILLQRTNLRSHVGLRNRHTIQRAYGMQLYRQRLFSMIKTLLTMRKG